MKISFNIYVVVIVLLLLFSATFSSKLFFLESDGTSYTNSVNAWGDLGWHVANITSFAEGQTLPPRNPIFAGESLTYPFLINYLSGLVLRLTNNIFTSIFIPTTLLMTTLLSLYFVLAKKITRNNLAATISLLLLIGGGGVLGITRFPAELLQYSGFGSDADSFHFLNIVLAGLLPQRSMLVGLPIAFAILLLILPAKRGLSFKRYLVAGLLAGILPLAHAHTVIAIAPLIILLATWQLVLRADRWAIALQKWSIFVLSALITGTPVMLYYVIGTADTGNSFMRWGPGWTADDINWLWFWFKNTGLIIPLQIAASWMLARRMARSRAQDSEINLLLFSLAGFFVFILANVFLFAPWAWDNWKLLIWWYMLSLPAIGWMLAQLVRFNSKRSMIAVALVVILHTASGTFDLARFISPSAPTYSEWDQDQANVASAIHEVSQVEDVILSAPYHNNPVALTGRSVYLGYPGHIWSHGLNAGKRQQSIKDFYEGRITKLPDSGIDYALVGPKELSNYKVVIQPTWQLVHENETYQLYKL